MAFTPAWRNFKRMQDLTVTASGLIYAAAAVHTADRLPADAGTLALWMVVYPAAYLAVSLTVPLAVPPLRRWLARYVWMSFLQGFGQTVASTVIGVVLMLAAGAFVYWQAASMAANGELGANVFSAYASGIGILAAQALLVRVLERSPEIRAIIELR